MNDYKEVEPIQSRHNSTSIKMVPWYDCLIAHYLYLFLLAPVGIWRIYVNKRFTLKNNLIISIGSLIWFTFLIFIIISSFGDSKKASPPNITSTPTHTVVTATPTPDTTVALKFYINADSVRLRSAPTTDSEVIATLNKGDIVTKEMISGDWSQVTTITKTGYIHNDLLSEENP